MMTDPISDMLTRIRNASRVRHKTVNVPHSKLKTQILEVLKTNGYIEDFKVATEGAKSTITVFLRYDPVTRESSIDGIERVSTPGRRVHVPSAEIPQVLSGLGLSVLSTSKGVLTDRQARAEKVGGEVLLKVW